MNREKYALSKIAVYAVIFSLGLSSFVLRLLMLGHDLPYYSIDENDVVESALAFVAGDWDPRWYKYGPLFSYLLAIIYDVQQWFEITFLGGSSETFFYDAFFDSASFYYIARTVHLIVILLIAVASARFCWRYYEKQTAYVALLFSIAPVIELITGFTVRVDTLQGLLALVCLYFTVSFKADDKYYKSYVITGIFAGLVFATKPLIGTLLLPAVFVAHLFTMPRDASFTISQVVKQLFVQNKGLYVFIGTLIITHSLVNPYSIIKFSSFWHEQYQVIFTQSDQGGSMAGYNFLWLFDRWGMLLALLALISPALLLMRRDRATCVLVTYIVTFVTLFMFFKTRDYWYNAIIPTLITVMAILFTTSANQIIKKYHAARANKPELVYVVALLFVISPMIKMGFDVSRNLSHRRADQVAQEWVESNVPSGSRILAVGWYAATLPRLRALDVKTHAVWGEYFMYSRNENQAWVRKYLQAYEYLKSTNLPTYRIMNIRKHYHGGYQQQVIGSITTNELFSSYLSELAKKSGAEFIITASTENYSGDWETGNDVELLADFNGSNGYRGAEVKIFRVKKNSIHSSNS